MDEIETEIATEVLKLKRKLLMYRLAVLIVGIVLIVKRRF